MNEHIAALLRIQRTARASTTNEPIFVSPGPLRLATNEHWCRRCGEQIGFTEHCLRCGSRQIVPAQAILKPDEYLIAN